MPRRLYLYGPPGAGKSAAGRQIGRDLEIPFVDLDSAIEAAAGRTTGEILRQDGEASFREREVRALKALPDEDEAVIALGGGTLLDENCRALVDRTGSVLCLGASFDVLERRLQADGADRPLIAGEDGSGLRRLLAQRSSHYASFPRALDTSALSAEEAARRAEAVLGAFRVRGMGPAYDVRLEPGSSRSVGARMASMRLGGPIGLVSDRAVGRRYGGPVAEGLRDTGYDVAQENVPTGERAKRPATLERIWRSLLAGGLERGSTVVALGGGVVGDVAGLAAATLLRGLAWVILPTSLLAMVDSSLGGKTGIDLPEGKNLVGALHPPRLVLADPDLLRTLPEREWRCGMAEVVKHGVIGDEGLLARCREGLEAVRRDPSAIVGRAMAVKIRRIEADPWEQGARAALNFGHTIGHALERAAGFRLRHGEAVAIGMVVEARLAARIGLADRRLADEIASVLIGLGLPTKVPRGVRAGDLRAAAGFDKKRRNGEVLFALPRRLGEMEVGVKVEDWPAILEES
jgi:3-dehydroquinate synthase